MVQPNRPTPEGFTGALLPPAPPRQPKKPTPEQLKKIVANYKELRAAVTRAGALVLEMARHPDITEDKLMECVRIYRRVYQGLRDVHESCRKNIGDSGSMFRPHPWETRL